MIAESRSNIRTFAMSMVCAALAALAAAAAGAADLYDSALTHPGRSAEDLKRDALDHPATVLRLAGIKPGMRVLDFMAGDGYYSELLSQIVGPKGHVLLVNNPAFDRWANNAWERRIAHGRLPNVEHLTVDPNRLPFEPASLDAILLIKVYHDLYWVDADEANWPRLDTPAVLDRLVKSLKPQGVLVIVDHSAKPGSGITAASTLHRIDEAYTRHDFESRGMKVIASSDELHRADDPRTQVSYKEPILGKTDRFVLVFRKTSG